MKPILIIIFIALCLFSSVIPIHGTDVWFSQFVAVALFGSLIVATKIYEMSKALGIFYAYAVISMVFVAHFNTMSMIEIFMTGLCGIIAVEVSKFTYRQRKQLFYLLTFLLVVQIIYGFIQKFNLDPIFKRIGNLSLSDTVGFSGSHNQYSFFMSILSPLLFENIYLVIFVFLGISLSTSISGLLGMLAGFIFYYREYKKMIFISIILAIFLITGFLIYTKKSYSTEFSERLDLWKLSISQVIHGKATLKLSDNVTQIKTCNPLLGYGMSSFFKISPFTQSDVIAKNSHGTHRYEHAHNDYIEILFDLGIVGILLFINCIRELVMFLRKVIWDNEFNLLISMLICFSVCALSIYTIHTAYNGLLVAVLVGLIFSKIKESLA